MRENRPYGSEGGESSLTGLPYPYFAAAAYAAQNRQLASLNVKCALLS